MATASMLILATGFVCFLIFPKPPKGKAFNFYPLA